MVKGAFFLLLALLAAFALAASSSNASTTSSLMTSTTPRIDAYDASRFDSAPSQASDSGYPNKDPTDDDLMAELHTITGSNTTWPNISYSDISASSGNDVETLTSQNGMKHLKGWYRVDIRMGLMGTHVGTFGGERLYNRIYEVLKRCKHGSSLDDCAIHNVVYSKDGKYATDSKLYMNILVSTINTRIGGTQPGGLEDLTFRMMARAFQKMTETPRNCYKADFDEGQGGGRGLWFCNVASQVMIAYPINGGPMQSLLKLTLEWDRPTDQGKYKCDEITQSNTIRDWVSRPFLNDYYLLGGKRQDAFKKEIAKLHNWNADKIAPYTSCLWNHCFNTRTELSEPRHAWIEVDDCEPDWNPIGCDPGAETRNRKSLNCPPEYRGTRSYTYGKVNQRDDGDYSHWT